jgi:hypothetical protein
MYVPSNEDAVFWDVTQCVVWENVIDVSEERVASTFGKEEVYRLTREPSS